MRKTLLCCLLLTTAAGLAACGNDDGSSAAAATSSPSSATSPSATPSATASTSAPASPDVHDPAVQAKALDAVWGQLSSAGRKQVCHSVHELGPAKAADKVVATQGQLTNTKFDDAVVAKFFAAKCS